MGRPASPFRLQSPTCSLQASPSRPAHATVEEFGFDGGYGINEGLAAGGDGQLAGEFPMNQAAAPFDAGRPARLAVDREPEPVGGQPQRRFEAVGVVTRKPPYPRGRFRRCCRPSRAAGRGGPWQAGPPGLCRHQCIRDAESKRRAAEPEPTPLSVLTPINTGSGLPPQSRLSTEAKKENEEALTPSFPSFPFVGFCEPHFP